MHFFTQAHGARDFHVSIWLIFIKDKKKRNEASTKQGMRLFYYIE